jgi:uncharacterized protein (TIGR03083 family)
MAKTDTWTTIHTERKALATDLGSLQEDQWTAASLCSGWTVRDVVAHMTATAKMTPPSFFGKMLASGFSFPKVQAKGISSEMGGSPAETLDHFAGVEMSTKHPPGPSDTMLGETIIHSQDIRGSLGIHHDYPMGAVVQVADFFKGSNLLIGAKRRIAGLTLRATDADWTHGTGPEVAGPILSLVMAMTGRTVAVADLSGDGTAILRERS